MNTAYRSLPFSEERPKDQFFTYLSISQCNEVCNERSDNITKCRVLGILYSEYGKFYLKDWYTDLKIRLSMAYLKEPVKSTITPYAVQVFGDLQWRNRPVIFLKIVKMLTIPQALRLESALKSVVDKHYCTRDSTTKASSTHPSAH